MLMGTLAGVEIGSQAAGVPHQPNGVRAAIDFLASGARSPPRPEPQAA